MATQSSVAVSITVAWSRIYQPWYTTLIPERSDLIVQHAFKQDRLGGSAIALKVAHLGDAILVDLSTCGTHHVIHCLSRSASIGYGNFGSNDVEFVKPVVCVEKMGQCGAPNCHAGGSQARDEFCWLRVGHFDIQFV